MAASIPWNELRRSRRGQLRVLDPMVGSGTTAVIARTLGHRAIGFDTDPLAVLIARAWCSDVNETATLKAAARVREAAKQLGATIPLRDAYPANADEETRVFVRYWFSGTVRRELAALARAIKKVPKRSVRDILWCAFSRLIITKQAGASLALDVAHSRPHKVANKTVIQPITHFDRAVRAVLLANPFKVKIGTPRAWIRTADARRLPLKTASIDVAICSPPYLNAIDYLRGHKFSLVWMGHSIPELRHVRANNIGTEVSAGVELDDGIIPGALRRMGDVNSLSQRQKRLLGRYVHDMDKALHELHRVLVKGGRAVLVAGDCTMRGVYVRNSGALAYLGKRHGFEVIRRRRRKLPPNRRYLPPPSSRHSGQMLRNRLHTETLLDFAKV